MIKSYLFRSGTCKSRISGSNQLQDMGICKRLLGIQLSPRIGWTLRCGVFQPRIHLVPRLKRTQLEAFLSPLFLVEVKNLWVKLQLFCLHGICCCSCRFGETVSLNCGHQMADCSSPGWYMSTTRTDRASRPVLRVKRLATNLQAMSKSSWYLTCVEVYLWGRISVSVGGER
jgi:hypothetical protein